MSLPRPVVVLLTDFGADSEYVGIMKGVLLTRHPTMNILDLFHEVVPQNIRQGAWVLSSACRYFPPGAVFCCVVDPGVGSSRQAVAVAAGSYHFVGPDNGLLYPAVSTVGGPKESVRLSVPATVAPTFHGRDVFAPAAARLAAGEPLASQGIPAEALTPLEFHVVGRGGEVVHVDRFGNLVTTLPPLRGKETYRVDAPRYCATLPWYSHYDAAPIAQPFLVTGSAGTLEFSLRNAAAAAVLPFKPGDRLRIY